METRIIETGLTDPNGAPIQHEQKVAKPVCECLHSNSVECAKLRRLPTRHCICGSCHPVAP